MTRNSVRAVAAAALAVATAAAAVPASAQEAQSTVSITPYAGYMWFGDLAEYSSGGSLTNDDSWIYGGQLKVRLSPNWAIVGNGSYAKTNFQNEGVGSTTVPTSGKIGYFLMDADLELAFPALNGNSRVAPFVQAGVGAVRYTVNPDLDGFNDASQTDLAFNAGVGVEAQVGHVGLQLMVKDYITSLDWNDFSAFTDQVQNDNIDRSRIANNLALTGGLRISF